MKKRLRRRRSLAEPPEGAKSQRILIEVSVFYLVFFASGLIPRPYPEVMSFSVSRELLRLFGYTLPGTALLWLLSRPVPKPGFSDGIACLLSLPCLIGFGFGVSAVAAWAGFPPANPPPETPAALPAWTILAADCLGTGYLEEGFFRFRLIRRLAEAGLSRTKSLALSALLFGACHIYEGPGGVFNAILAGLTLSLISTRLHAPHGIAWSHGCYNFFAYLLSIL